MTRPGGSYVDNVVPLRRSPRACDDRGPVPARDMADAVRSFDRLERCAATLQSGPPGIPDETDPTEWPIVSFQVQLPVIQRWLHQLGRITVASWPDTRWALRLDDARTAAALRLHAVTRSLYHSPPGTGPLDGRLAADIRGLADAVHGLRQLIAQECQEEIRAP
jgi:hypothetical protein